MTPKLTILRAGPLTTIQDAGRFGMLRDGISASGPMDTSAFRLACVGGQGAIEITVSGIEFGVETGSCHIGFAGGAFNIEVDNVPVAWPGSAFLKPGSIVSIRPGAAGNYGYVRFDKDIAVQRVMGSIATSSRVLLGGANGAPLKAGDFVLLDATGTAPPTKTEVGPSGGPFRFVWGVHADMFAASVREQFLTTKFTISKGMDRMGVRLEDHARVFAGASNLSLVSEAIVPGDVQILGDGTPIVLMRDHQPTGGYPRIATIITADLDRFAQMRPGTSIAFAPVTVEHAQHLLRGRA